MLRTALERGELSPDVDADLLAETLTAFTLRRMIFRDPPIDDSLRAALHTLVRQPATHPALTAGVEVLTPAR